MIIFILCKQQPREIFKKNRKQGLTEYKFYYLRAPKLTI